jgi:hypothetical protein
MCWSNRCDPHISVVHSTILKLSARFPNISHLNYAVALHISQLVVNFDRERHDPPRKIEPHYEIFYWTSSPTCFHGLSTYPENNTILRRLLHVTPAINIVHCQKMRLLIKVSLQARAPHLPKNSGN